MKDIYVFVSTCIKPYTLRFLNVWSIQLSKDRAGGLYEG